MKVLRFLSVLLLMCSLPLCAFAAMDEGYIKDSTKWQFNNEVVLGSEQRIGSYRGIYNYYSDVANNCFYLQLSYEEDSLVNDDTYICLQFNIKNDDCEYQLLIDESGFINAADYAPKTFDVRVDFGEIWLNGQVIYVGIEFLNKNDKKLNNYLNFSLLVNESVYELCDENIKLAYGDYTESQNPAKPTEAKPSTTKESATKEPTTKKETTTKFKYTYTTTTQPAEKEPNNTAEKTTKPKTETTTKFKYSGATGFSSSGEYIAGADGSDDNSDGNSTPQIPQDGANRTENGIIIPETNSAAEKSTQAKLLTAMAVICAVAGGAIITRNVSPKKKAANETDTEE